MVVERSFVSEGHVHRFVVTQDKAGWELIEQEDAKVIRRLHQDDWHRVERALRRFEQTVTTPTAADSVRSRPSF